MVGGADHGISHVPPFSEPLAPAVSRLPPRTDPLSYGNICRYGCSTVVDQAGHFVKMVHNGVEYGIMQLSRSAFKILHEGHRWDKVHQGR